MACSALSIPALLCLLLTGFVTYFFRDPARVLPEETGAIVCPADGKIIVLGEVDDDRFLHMRVQKISIFMNVFNVHVNRIPLTGTVERVVLSPGKFYAADKDKAVLHNEFCALTLATPDKQRYTMVQIAGLIARRIVCRAEKGDRVTAGERFGMIRFGSRVDLYLAAVDTGVGQRWAKRSGPVKPYSVISHRPRSPGRKNRLPNSPTYRIIFSL